MGTNGNKNPKILLKCFDFNTFLKHRCTVGALVKRFIWKVVPSLTALWNCSSFPPP